MDVDDWNTVLGPKVLGSWNLDNAFSSPDLDFFTMLSSAAGVIGNPGQGNYSAANNFQDAYARYHPKSFNTRYSSLSLPLVGGSVYIEEILESGRSERLARIGSYIMPFEEVLQVIEYSMPNSGDMPRTHHAIMGFDRESIVYMPDRTFWTPMFETLPRNESGDGDDNGDATSKRDIEGLLRGATTMDEAVNAIAQATVEKFAVFLNIPVEDLSIHQAPASIGLDSLVSIELKNWMVRAFKATLQATELMGAPSILHLAGTLAMRSKFVSAELRNQSTNGQSNDDDGHGAQDKTQTNGVTANDKSGPPKEKCCGIHQETPRLPVPDLDKAMKNYLDSSVHLAESEEELETFRAAVEHFTAPDSLSRKIYEDIKHKANDPATGGNWANDYLLEHTFLRRREPTQYHSFAALYHPSKHPHTQAEQAAIIATAAFRYKKEIDEGTLEPEYMLGTRVCTAFNKWLFNTARLPGIGKDETKKGSGDYCVVLRRGRAFVVPLQQGDQVVSLDAVKDTMDAILDHVQDEGTWAGLLTSDSRDSWAKVRPSLPVCVVSFSMLPGLTNTCEQLRDSLVSMSPQNAEYLDTIESSAFIICLDDGNPVTPEERATHCRFGDGSNRWHDKGVQFTVAANGNSGVIFEHSYIDGTLPIALHSRIADAMDEYRPATANATLKSNGDARKVPQELRLTTDAEMDEHIGVLKEKWSAFSNGRDFIFQQVPELGAKLVTGNNLPLKGVFDATLQLAMHFYYGTLPVNWQPVALTQFHEGRHDLVQLNSPAVKAFCEAATDESMAVSDRRALMRNAALDLNARLRDAKEGHGYYRMFHVMEKQYPADAPRAAIYDHPLQRRLNDFRSISYINHDRVESVLVSLDPNALRLKYTIGQDGYVSPPPKSQRCC